MSDLAGNGGDASVRDGADSPAERGHVPMDRDPGVGTQKRLLWIVVASLLLAAAGLWGSSRMVWIELPHGLITTDGKIDSIAGGDLVESQVPIAFLVLAAVAAVLALRGRVRRLFGGVLLVLIGGWALYETVNGTVYETSGIVLPGYTDTGGTFEQVFWGPALSVAAVVLIVGAGVLLLWRGHRMPEMGKKYSAPGAGRTSPDPESEIWDALSDGEDPTVR